MLSRFNTTSTLAACGMALLATAPLRAGTLNIVSWGSAYQRSQDEAYF